MLNNQYGVDLQEWLYRDRAYRVRWIEYNECTAEARVYVVDPDHPGRELVFYYPDSADMEFL